MQCYYRYHEILYTESRILLVLDELPIIKTTDKGVWVNIYGRKRFVLKDAKKRYACPTKEEALESYYARKERQHRILSHQLRQVEAALKLSPNNQEEYFF